MKYFIIGLKVAILSCKLEYRIKNDTPICAPRIVEYEYRPSDQSPSLS